MNNSLLLDLGDEDSQSLSRANQELNRKVLQREQLMERINSLRSNLTYFDSLSTFQLEARLSLLERQYNSFELVQAEIESLDEAEILGKHRASMENSYCEIKGAISERLAVARGNEINSVFSSTRLNSSAINNHINLPKLQLSTFSGKPTEWLDFFNMFSALVHNNAALSQIEKFQYLRSCLADNAMNIIQSLEVSSENYLKAIDLLKCRFDNKRFIFQSHLQAIFNIKGITHSNATVLRGFIDQINSHLRAMQSLATINQIAESVILQLMVTKLDYGTQIKWEEELSSNWSVTSSSTLVVPTWNDLSNFIERRCQASDMVHINQVLAVQGPKLPSLNTQASKFKPTSLATAISKSDSKCVVCGGAPFHHPYRCHKFLDLTPVERHAMCKQLNLCLNCLGANHRVSSCPSLNRCQQCTSSHHTLLHRDKSALNSNLHIEQDLDATANTSTIFHASQKSNNVILATAIIYLSNSLGVSVAARALLDSGSQLNFVTERIAQHLRVPRTKCHMKVRGIGSSATSTQHSCSVVVRAYNDAYSSTMEALVLSSITSYQPSSRLEIKNWNIPKNIRLADEGFNLPGPIDCLIGASLFYDLLLVGQISTGHNLPILQKTKFGWVVSGAFVETSPPSMSSLSATSLPSHLPSISPTSHSLASSPLLQPSSLISPSLPVPAGPQNVAPPVPDKQPVLEELLQRFWTIECLSHRSPTFTIEEEECENFFNNTTKRCPIDNRFIVRLPFKEDPNSLGNSYNNALKRLVAIESKIKHNKLLNLHYHEFINEYISLEHIKYIPPSEVATGKRNYLPHHCVITPDSSTTKLRVVFDGSCRTTNGKSLNDILKVGPTLQNDIHTILLRFRFHKYVLMADITKMYRQILVDPADAKWQCILWRNSPSDPIATYQLQTVTYGLGSSSYLATKCLMHLAQIESETFPSGCKIVARDFYVDNLMTGGKSIEEVIEIKKQVIKILRRGGFPLRKFASNHSAIIDDIPETDREEMRKINDTVCVKALGLQWAPNQDYFLFCYNQLPNSSKPTKRSILSHIASIFDPLGLVNPLIVKCKILMQELWRLRLHWDESVPQGVHTQWMDFCQQLTALNNVKIPRFILYNQRTQIHAFADASTRAYGACIYIVSEAQDGTIESSLLFAKSRVAPIKSVTLPKLELCAALLLAEALGFVTKCGPFAAESLYCWSDSTIALGWIEGEPSRWKTFVANRVSKIRELTQHCTWHHVPSHQNPADLISRGVNACDLVNNRLWFHGPDFLTQGKQFWPTVTQAKACDMPEQRNQKIVLLCQDDHDIISTNKYISNYNKLVRIFAYVKRFIMLLKRNRNSNWETTVISVPEFNTTLEMVCRIIQQKAFPSEYSKLVAELPLNRESRIRQLSPFLHNNVIRVGGRLQNSSLPFDSKHPILLPSHHPFVHSLILHYHRKHQHAGIQTLISLLREKFWILNARNCVKLIIYKCVLCFRMRPVVTKQIMGSLPADRIEPALPFHTTGVDYCGPFLITQRIQRRAPLKVYISLFICFTTKAVHLEVVHDLSTSSFIAALRRFIARRGKCHTIYSDNATNFIGANRELQELLRFFKSQQHVESVKESCLSEGIAWKFIPPRSPHFGGLWESAIKLAKYYLRRAIGTHILTLEELQTVACQAEAIINSRPLTPLSNDPNDLRPLTPAHFLIGRTAATILEPSLLNSAPGILHRYQIVQWIQQSFWQRWRTEYIRQLQQRNKWPTACKNLEPNDLVIISDDGVPPLRWPMGRVIQAIPGPDGRVRVVTVKTAEGIYKRSITKICKLPIESNTGDYFGSTTSKGGEDVPALA